jgi:hypothetical protein
MACIVCQYFFHNDALSAEVVRYEEIKRIFPCFSLADFISVLRGESRMNKIDLNQ